MNVEHTALLRRFLREGPHRIEDIGGNRGRRQQRGAAIDLKAGQIHTNSPKGTSGGAPHSAGGGLSSMLRWKGNGSHFLIAARSGKSFRKSGRAHWRCDRRCFIRHQTIARDEGDQAPGWSEIVEKGCLTRHFVAFRRFNAPPKA
jgi:hypothetical protein